jgi:hypothetical protein
MATIKGSAPRRLSSWTESFLDYTAESQSPRLYRKWAAVSCIAGVLERKVWVRLFGRTLYPNIYCLLVGGPGIGKTDAIRDVRHFWKTIPDIFVAPTSVTLAALVDRLYTSQRKILRPTEIPPLTTFHSLQVGATEFGTLLAGYDASFMSTLNELYDCLETYDEARRGEKKEPKVFPNPQLNIIAGTTPAWLSGTLPPTAWAEGFASRTLMAFSAERFKLDPFTTIGRNEKLDAALSQDLAKIFGLWGTMMWDPEAAEMYKNWYLADMPPTPAHPKLEHYLPRRHIHFAKLLMIFSAARSDEQIIRVDDFQMAQSLILETEALMPEVFKSMTMKGDSNTIDEIYHFVWKMYNDTKKDVPEHVILRFISQHVPTHTVVNMLKLMVESQILEITEIGGPGRNKYRPKPKA